MTGWKLRLVVATVALLQLTCGGQQDTSPTPGPTPVPVPLPVPAPTAAAAMVTGHLVDADTNAPTVGALVTWHAAGGALRSVLSDGAGYFAFSDVPLGAVRIEARTNFASAERALTLTGHTVVDMVLAPHRYVLYGRVTDVITGLPLAGATLTVVDPPFAREPNSGRTTTTGSDGAYRLIDMWTGTSRVQIRRAGYDPVFDLVTLFFTDKQHDIQMRVAQQTLAGTWNGEMAASGFAAGVPVWLGFVTVRHSDATIAADGPDVVLAGTLDDASAIGTTTRLIGTLTLTRSPSGPRLPPPPSCVGTGAFTGTATWTRISITAPQVRFSCGGTETVTVTLTR